MAKNIQCVFCGKEMSRGFFSGDADSFDIAGKTLDCCSDCRAVYQKEAKRVGKRFVIKLENAKKAAKARLDGNAVAQMLRVYLAEEKEQIARCGCVAEKEDGGYFAFDPTYTRFAVREFSLGSDVTAKQMIKSSKALTEVGEVWFDKSDVTKLEYRTTFVGESLGFFSSAYSFEIRLNDEKVLTYKPCITKAFFVGTGLFPHSQKKKAKLQCAAVLGILKSTLGIDAEVREVKKFL